MAKFIEEFYYGNLDPQARSTKQNKTVQKQMEVLMLNEDFLTENLSGESKKKFLDFCNAWGVVNGESNLDSFIMGFRLGAVGVFHSVSYFITQSVFSQIPQGIYFMEKNPHLS